MCVWHRRRKEFWDGGQNHRGPGARESSSGVQGRSPIEVWGTKSPEAEEFLK